jgi:hypothetical protein
MMSPEICNNTPYAKTYEVNRSGETLAIVNVPGGGCKTITLGPFDSDTPKISISWQDDAGNSFNADYYDYYDANGSPPIDPQRSTDTVGSFDHLEGNPLEAYPGLIDWDDFDDATLDPLADPASDETLRKGFDQNYALALEANQALINQLNDLKAAYGDLNGVNSIGFSNVNGNLVDLETAIADVEARLNDNKAALDGMRSDMNTNQGAIAGNTATSAAADQASAADLAAIKSTLGTIAGNTTGLAKETTLNELKSQNFSQLGAIEGEIEDFRQLAVPKLNDIDGKLNLIRIGTEAVESRILSLNQQQATRNNELKQKFDANTSQLTQIKNEVNTQGTRIVNELAPMAGGIGDIADNTEVIKDLTLEQNGKLQQINDMQVNAYDQFEEFKDNQEQFQYENTNRLDIIATALVQQPTFEEPGFYGNQGKSTAETTFTELETKGDQFMTGATTATGGSLDGLKINIPVGLTTYTIDMNPASNASLSGFLNFSLTVWTWILRVFYVGLLWYTIEQLLRSAPAAQQQGLAFPGLFNNPIVKIPFALAVTILIGSIPVFFFTWLEVSGYSTAILGNPFDGTGFGTSIELARLGYRFKAMFIYQGVCAFIRAIGK